MAYSNSPEFWGRIPFALYIAAATGLTTWLMIDAAIGASAVVNILISAGFLWLIVVRPVLRTYRRRVALRASAPS